MSRLSVLLAVISSIILAAVPFTSAQTTVQATLPSAALANDLAVLNYALTLENADSTFFSSFLQAFNATAPFNASSFTAAGYNASVYTNLVQIAQEEINHAAILAATVTALGGTPVPKCTYNFSGVTSVLSYLTIGQLFENTGTSAYDGGINGLTNSSLQQAAATIATVEARHASYLNNLLGTSPFSVTGFDTALTPTAVAAIIAPFLASCPYNVTAGLPTVRPYGVALASGTNGSTLTTNFVGYLAAGNNNYTQADLTNDLNVLNYALVLENLESAFYNYSQSLYNATSFANAGFNSSVYTYFQTITSNEAVHVATLSAVISSLGATPNPPCNYSSLFSLVTSVQSYIAVAQLLENTGVSAYDGAVNGIASTALQQVAATIATIEARHAAFLNQLAGSSPFPNSTDTPLSPATIAAAVAPLQVCGFVPSLPSVARVQAPLATVTNGTLTNGTSVTAPNGTSTSVGYNATLYAASVANDLTVLNYALTLENLENQFYIQALAKFNASAFSQGNFNYSTYQMFQMISAHESQHVATLTAVINGAGGTAVPNCTYNFTAALSSVGTFIATALALETGGQQAYDGALNGITNPAYAAAAATIATVEARHTAYLSLIQNVPQVPFPQAFDNATLPAAIAVIISPFIVSCPYNITLPYIPRPSGVALNGTTIVATGQAPASYTSAQLANDLVVLNYALTLEKLEANFYNYAVATFSQQSFTNAGYPAYYYQYSQIIQSHENTHVAALTAVIVSRGGTPVPNCTYSFGGITTVQQYLAIAQVLENTGVAAYDGAANTITDTNLQQVAATIVTVEARHAAFLNLANNASAFPNTFDSATPPATIIAAVVATGLISCPYPLVGPSVITPLPLATGGTSVRGDPSFVGFHGQSFQVHGIPNRYFNLLSTPSLQMNALFRMLVDGDSMSAGEMKAARVSRQLAAAKKGSSAQQAALPLTTAYSHEGTFLAEMGLSLNGGAVRVFAAAGAYVTGFSTVSVNGVAVRVSSAAVEVSSQHFVTLSSPSVLTIDTPQVSFTLVNADQFFNIEQATLNQQHTADAQMDGLLGQTADEAWKVESTKQFKQHMVYDYLVADMDAFSTDYVSSMFETKKVETQ